MDSLVEYGHFFYESYVYYMESADDRVADWPLMQSYWPCVCLVTLYLLMIPLGTTFMRDRKPLNCYWMMLVYNVSMVAMNFHIFLELLVASRKLGYSLSCQPMDYSYDPDEMRIARALWWYFISKLVEFLDTMFFIVRKKNSQITFLHVFHHGTMFPLWWIGMKWVAGGQAVFGALLNSFVHVIMYLYYCLSALGPSVRRHLWWKKYLTILQLVQFVAGLSHAVQSLYVGCPFPKWMHYGVLVYGTLILALFINFYIQAYLKPNYSNDDQSGVGGQAVVEVKGQERGKDCKGCPNGYENGLKLMNGHIKRH